MQSILTCLPIDMWSFEISCPQCGYEFPPLADGLNIQDGSFTALFVRNSDKKLRIRVIKKTELEALGVDFDTGDGFDEAVRAVGTPEEEELNLPRGEDASFEARCPNCGHVGLHRKINGIIWMRARPWRHSCWWQEAAFPMERLELMEVNSAYACGATGRPGRAPW